MSEERMADLRGLISWLEQQPSEAEYNSNNPGICLLACWLGRPADWSADSEFLGAADVVYPWPHTYGAALKRARALLAETTP